MSLITLNGTNFKAEVLEAEEPVLVDFFATWCGPCRMMGPVLEELASELPGVKIGKVDIDESSEIASAYGVNSVPTFILFENGEQKDKCVGAVPKAKLLSMLGKR